MSGIKIQKSLPVQPQITNPDARLREAAQMYEQHFLNEMVKSMRKTVGHSQMTAPNMAEKIYSEQLDGQYVESWANRGGVGLAEMIHNQLQDRFFNNGGAPRPHGPIPVEKGTILKIDESTSRQGPVPSLSSGSSAPDVSFLYEWEHQPRTSREVLSPYDGDVISSYHAGGDRQMLKLAHDNGLVSTISFLGQTKDLKPGDSVRAGQKIGLLSAGAQGLTWQVGKVES